MEICGWGRYPRITAQVSFPRSAGRCGVRGRPDDPGRQCSVRRTRLMGSGVFLGLCDGEVQRGNTTQEFRASVEVKAGSVSAKVGG